MTACVAAGTEGFAAACTCKPNYTGGKCDRCAAGYYGPTCAAALPRISTSLATATVQVRDGRRGETLPFLCAPAAVLPKDRCLSFALPPPLCQRLMPFRAVLEFITVHAANVDYSQA